ncbi:hypothetical protein [Nocardia sp. XZ_19_385]|uniref:helix-turn-helix domain-containing protein n=1 Tax=Nocardia sp. XZ_19_385 TaxID=2769488 RepID=UPI00188DF44E|nr:hypothetical protein [Nocardia sp. XZ_19_385]
MNDESDDDHDEVFYAAADAEYEEDVRWLLHQARRGNRLDKADRMALTGLVMRDRKAFNVTQLRLSELSGVPLRTIKHMEAGGVPQTSTLMALVDGIATARKELQPRLAQTRDPGDPMQMFMETVGPMYQELSPQAQGQALRQFILWMNDEILKEKGGE